MMRAKALVAQKAELVAAVAAINLRQATRCLWGMAAISVALLASGLDASVLPEDRADIMYHSYNGGGVTINGPSLLVRKSIKEKYSVRANYYVDMVSSASIDVVSTASPYTEKRVEKSLGFDYLHDKTVISSGFTTSDENDYNAKTAYLDLSQEFFGSLTTLSLGFSRGWDDIGQITDPNFSRHTDRQNYRLGLSQILTRDWLVDIGLEAITDEGYLNNPYRVVRYKTTDGNGFGNQAEVYPKTRTSNAISLRTRYYLPYRAAIGGEYRFFDDTWGIQANSLEINYTQPWRKDWEFAASYRYYTQTHADFYSDLYPYKDAQNFLARDKELSEFSSNNIGLGVSYAWRKPRFSWMHHASFNAKYDFFSFQYDDFRDVLGGGGIGAEPMYSFTSGVWRLYLSVWY